MVRARSRKPSGTRSGARNRPGARLIPTVEAMEGRTLLAVTPGIPDLIVISDTGVSSTDNITNLNNSSLATTLQFDVTGTIAGANVSVLAGGVAIGSAVATGATTTVTTNGSTIIADGPQAITALQTMGGMTSPASPALTVTIDTIGPMAAILDVEPDPRNSEIDAVTIVFNEAVVNFDLADLSLTRDGGPNLLTTDQMLSSGDGITFTLDNLADLTTTQGSYALTLADAASGITDQAGNALAGTDTDAFVVDTTAPTVDIIDVTPDLRTSAVDTITIVFSERVSGFDLADLTLTVSGGRVRPNRLTDAQTLTTGDGRTWTLANLAGLTGVDGAYVLALAAAGSGITDPASNALLAGASDTFIVDITAPTVIIVGVPAANPEGTAINLTSSVTDPRPGAAPGPGAAAFTYAWSVTKNGAAFASGGAANFSFTPDDDATYMVTLRATDAAGLAGTSTAIISVSNVAPSLAIGGAGTAQPGIAAYALNLSALDPGADTIASWTIDWGDGTVETFPGVATVVTHIFARCATYTIRATASDEDGTFVAGNTVTVVADFATRNQCFVAEVYVDLLGRPVDRLGLSDWSLLLDQGMRRDQVVLAIAQTLEGRTVQVQGYYQRYLGRAADAFGLNNFVGGLQDGRMRSEDVIAAIIGSPEYLSRTDGTDAAFLDRAYFDLLGRPLDDFGRMSWSADLARGRSRIEVALGIFQSEEGRRFAVEGFYQRFLRRAADPGGLGNFAEALRLGATQELVLAAIVGSPEYLDRFVPAS